MCVCINNTCTIACTIIELSVRVQYWSSLCVSGGRIGVCVCVCVEVVLACVCRGCIGVSLWRLYWCVFVEVVLVCVCGGHIGVCL